MKKKNGLKKAAVALAIVLGLGIAGERLYQAYKKFYPVASAGECLKVNVKGRNFKLQVIQNNNEKHASLVSIEIEIFEGVKMQVPAVAEYKELRELGAERISCDEEVK